MYISSQFKKATFSNKQKGRVHFKGMKVHQGPPPAARAQEGTGNFFLSPLLLSFHSSLALSFQFMTLPQLPTFYFLWWETIPACKALSLGSLNITMATKEDVHHWGNGEENNVNEYHKNEVIRSNKLDGHRATQIELILLSRKRKKQNQS